jgi:hypothetical protein
MSINYLKCSVTLLVISSIILVTTTFKLRQNNKKHYFCPNCQDDDKFLEEAQAIKEVYTKASNLYKTKKKSFFSDIYTDVNQIDVVASVANLFRSGMPSNRSLRKLSAIADNVPDGQDKLKNNPLLKGAVTVMLNLNMMNSDARVNAAKIASRLNDVPVSIQMTAEDPEKAPKNADSFIIVPRKSRLYRPDIYVQNYKAGNWDA